MTVRTAVEQDLQQVVSLYQSFFPAHNIFRKEESEILTYLQEKMKKDTLLVYEEKHIIKAALFLVLKTKTEDHALWKLRHFAFDTLQEASILIQEAEKRISASSGSAKVEVTLAEDEEGLQFYEKQGYKREGRLSDHYRKGEFCVVLGKNFPSNG
ncbi:hypothetical protein COV20_02045 [Candidatus Woesearchaeota archaeon CG10_big_fil_rev_8_21_14_0_10_45_16]|nr:MAG: hypothetical protein COV20_02045 [Candidatus Woesearchaeota archaeon CG10_big_fil_rev_8_21_14_0_10_45_16]